MHAHAETHKQHPAALAMGAFKYNKAKVAVPHSAPLMFPTYRPFFWREHATLNNQSQVDCEIISELRFIVMSDFKNSLQMSYNVIQD